MNLESIKTQLEELSIYHSEDTIMGHKSVIGYEKKFRMLWMATQLNTFIVATDFEDMVINAKLIGQHVHESFSHAKQNYSGWPRGMQSGLGVISILMSKNVTEDAKEYCLGLKTGKKWAGFTIPVVYNTETDEIFHFKKNQIWGFIYSPHFRKLIEKLK